MENIKTLKESVIRAGKELSNSGLIARTWGNVSCRINDDEFIITASGRNYMTLTSEEIVRVRISDLSYDGDIKPSSELKVHAEIYRLKPDVGFIIHTHQNNASAVSAMGMHEIEFFKEYPGIGNKVICADYALPGTDELAQNTAAAAAKSDAKAVIMKNHGVVCYGRDYEETFEIAHILEDACGEYLEKAGVRTSETNEIKYEKSNVNRRNVVYNTSHTVAEFSKLNINLLPYLDDFAQLVGRTMRVIDDNAQQIEQAVTANEPVLIRGKGALCIAEKDTDMEALSMVIEKNCRAYFAAKVTANCPIKQEECDYMRNMYLNRYSKLFNG